MLECILPENKTKSSPKSIFQVKFSSGSQDISFHIINVKLTFKASSVMDQRTH